MPALCEGNLGIARCDMPQIPHMDSEIESVLRSRQIGTSAVELSVDALTPTQRDLSTNTVTRMIDSVLDGNWRDEHGPWSSKIVVTEDGHILDGHHRWAASKILATSDEPRIRDWRDEHGIDSIRLNATRVESHCEDGRGNIANIIAILNKLPRIEHTKCGALHPHHVCD